MAGTGATDAAAKATGSTGAAKVEPKPAKADANKPGVFVLPLEGTVGMTFRHEEMEKIAEEADRYGPGQIIVFRVKSGGGAVTEMEKIHKTLTEIKKRSKALEQEQQSLMERFRDLMGRVPQPADPDVPPIIAELGGLHLYAWTYTTYFLARAVALPIFGKLSDMFSTKVLFLCAIGMFLLFL